MTDDKLRDAMDRAWRDSAFGKLDVALDNLRDVLRREASRVITPVMEMFMRWLKR